MRGIPTLLGLPGQRGGHVAFGSGLKFERVDDGRNDEVVNSLRKFVSARWRDLPLELTEFRGKDRSVVAVVGLCTCNIGVGPTGQHSGQV